MALKADLTDKQAVVEAVRKVAPERVLHLAGISFVGHADETAFYAVNVVGTMNLLAALADLPDPPGKIVLASSANVYGNTDVSPIPEHLPPRPPHHYAMSKLAMEILSQAWLDRLPIVVSRPFNYTGPGQAIEFLIPKLVDHFVRRAPEIDLGNTDVEREFNDVRYVCDAYLALLEYGVAGETYNICTGRTYKVRQVIDILSQLTGHTLETRTNPDFVRANEVYRLAGNPGKLEQLFAQAGENVSPPDLRETLDWMLSDAGK